MAVYAAKQQGLHNFSALVSHVLVPPAMAAILQSPKNRDRRLSCRGTRVQRDGVSPVSGVDRALSCADRGRRIRAARHSGRHSPRRDATGSRRGAGGQRVRAHRDAGRKSAGAETAGRGLRGGRSCLARYRRDSGERLAVARAVIASSTPSRRFSVRDIHTVESPLCHSGEVLQGILKPNQCPAFGKECTPRKPLGATMVSSEGACAAYYHYGRFICRRSTCACLSHPTSATGLARCRCGTIPALSWDMGEAASSPANWLSTSSCLRLRTKLWPIWVTLRSCRWPAGGLPSPPILIVVQPLFFPGGSIGELAINGTVNDLAV